MPAPSTFTLIRYSSTTSHTASASRLVALCRQLGGYRWHNNLKYPEAAFRLAQPVPPPPLPSPPPAPSGAAAHGCRRPAGSICVQSPKLYRCVPYLPPSPSHSVAASTPWTASTVTNAAAASSWRSTQHVGGTSTGCGTRAAMAAAARAAVLPPPAAAAAAAAVHAAPPASA